jgi:hypothetical protein
MQTENLSDFRYINECIATKVINPANTLFILYKEDYISFQYIEKNELRLVEPFSMNIPIPAELFQKDLDDKDIQILTNQCLKQHKENLFTTQQITKINITKVVHIIQNTRLKKVCYELNNILLFDAGSPLIDSKVYNY